MIAFATEIRIERPLEEVFDYVSDPSRLPSWNSAVTGVRGSDGPTYELHRTLPGGHAIDELEVVDRVRPRAVTLRTVAGPTPFRYRYSFDADGRETIVRLDAEVDLPLLARWAVRRGVEANLSSLKAILERG